MAKVIIIYYGALSWHYLIVFEAIYQLLTSEEKAKGITVCFLFKNQTRINGVKLKDQD